MFCRTAAYAPSIFRCIQHPPRTSILRFNGILKFRSFTSTKYQANYRYVRFGDPVGGVQGPRKGSRDYKQDPRVRIGAILLAVGGVYYVAHLEQVPQTGRWRFMNTSPKAEAKIGEIARQEMHAEMQGKILPLNHPITRHVRRVVSRILTYSELGSLTEQKAPTFISPFHVDIGGDSWTPDADYGASSTPAYGPEKEWDVIVVNDNKMINAMAVPGLVIVFTGILPVCQDEQGLAAVLAHEIGHVVARHTAERMSSQTIFYGLLFLAQLFGIDWGLSQIANSLLLELPNSRMQEREADLIGLRLMSRACYDPKASPEMFNRLGRVEAKISSQVNLDFLQTHPSSATRVKYLEDHLTEGYAILASNPECGQMLEKYEHFRETARAIQVNDQGGWSLT